MNFLFIKEFAFSPEHILILTNILFLVIIVVMALIIFRLIKFSKRLKQEKLCLENMLKEDIAYQNFLLRQATIDNLTGVSNRNSVSKIDNILANCHGGAFFMLDVDDLKIVNDIHGHAAGDALLSRFGSILSRISKNPSDVIARIGGDEFVIFLPNVTTANQALKTAQNLLKELNSPFSFGEIKIMPSCSIGIALAPMHGMTYAELYEKADLALYRIKYSSKNGYALYDQESSEKEPGKKINR